MAEELGEKTEMPTSRRRRDARQKGQVPKSQDLTTAVQLIGSVLLLVMFGSNMVEALARVVRRVLSAQTPGSVLDTSSIRPAAAYVFEEGMRVAAPILVLIFAMTYLANVSQVGLMLTFKPLQPDLTKLNPAGGVKKLFGRRNLVKTLVNIVKLAVVLTVVVLVMSRNIPRMTMLPALEPLAAMKLMGVLAMELVAWLLVLMLLIGIVDLIYQRWQHTQDLKMTKQEVKDERRSMEGDPQVKRRRMKMAMQVAMQQVRSAVPDADVIVTNPTHFSVALRYDAQTMAAPRVVAKGTDFMAFRIREVAKASGVPMVERAPLARALYWGVEVGQEVSPEHYEAVAEVLAYIYRLDGRAA